MTDIKHIKKKDVVSIGVLCIVLFMVMYVLLGFWEYGLSTPYIYDGGDEFTGAEKIQTLKTSGWIWHSDMIGAPFGQDRVANPSTLMVNFDLCVEKLLVAILGDPLKTLNAYFLLIIPMCALLAFYVLREIGINRAIALFGATLFSCAPYIFARSVIHLTLASCYFVPLSILLCVWMMREDDDYLKLNRYFFRHKKNIATVIFCLLIANNGLGYYAVFTCYFLVITALYKLGKKRKLSAIMQPCIAIALIGIFFVLNVIPYVIYILKGGSSAGLVRGLSEVELYGLKIAQLFIPVNGHGIGIVEKLIHAYNSNMPLVNENSSAYLGLGGIAGFILSLMVLIFGGRKQNGESDELELFSQLNVWAILFATIGGFSSFVSLAGFQFLRSVNRISIFILFISICVLCVCCQRLFERVSTKKTRRSLKAAFGVCIALFVTVCLYDILPTYEQNDARLAANAEAYWQDHRFIEAIESQLDDGDMIYQMPYHKYPEAGSQNKMGDYRLLTGYLHSDKLKWSYGAIKGSYGDTWQELVSQMPMQKRTETMIATGYKGIYIDTRAYKEDELESLRLTIEAIIETSPLMSENGNLMFYDLRPFISTHPELSRRLMPTVAELGYKFFNALDLPVTGEHEKPADRDCLILRPSSVQYGPYTELPSGEYRVTIHGRNLDKADYDATYNSGTVQIKTTVVEKENDAIIYDFTFPENRSHVEFRLFNRSEEDIELDYIELTRE